MDNNNRLTVTDSVELLTFNDNNKEVESSCELPNLPGIRSFHSMVTNTICGGFTGQEGLDTCISLTEGQWTTTHTLPSPRYFHSTWQIPEGVVLLGGSTGYDYEMDRRADLVKTSVNSSVEKIFNLAYESVYVFI